MPNPRGSWTLAEAIKKRWYAANLDVQFRRHWPLPATDQWLTFNDTEARPAGPNAPHPRPYCIFEQGIPIIRGHMTGRDSQTEIQHQDVPVQFTIFAGRKELARDFAAMVAEAFDKQRLGMQDDGHITTFRDPDFPTRMDDRTWAWVLQYRFRIEAVYAGSYS